METLSTLDGEHQIKVTLLEEIEFEGFNFMIVQDEEQQIHLLQNLEKDGDDKVPGDDVLDRLQAFIESR